MGKQWKQWQTFIFLGSKITADGDYSDEIKRCLLLGRKAMTNLDSLLKSRGITLPTKVHWHSQSYSFSSSHVWMWELHHKKGWVQKKWGFWTVVLEKTPESLLGFREIQPVNPKGNQPWIFIGRTDAEAEAPILWPPDAKSWRIGKNPDAGKDWGQEEKEMTEDEMVGWHHWFNGHELEQALGDGEGQGSMVCCSPWGHRESDTTEWLNNKARSAFIDCDHNMVLGLDFAKVSDHNEGRGTGVHVGSLGQFGIRACHHHCDFKAEKDRGNSSPVFFSLFSER